MSYNTLISADTAYQHLGHSNWVFIDCRFSLADSNAGLQAYQAGHIPNARYAHLNEDLSSPITPQLGRHPLPDFNALVEKIICWGITCNNQVVVYDDANGAFAGRLWWLLQCLGHSNVAVLDGGIKHWLAKDLPLSRSAPVGNAGMFQPFLDSGRWLDTATVQQGLAQNTICLVDARTPERYHGDYEPIDPVAGHVPGAINRPFQHNLADNGLFLPADTLHQQFTQLLQGKPPQQVVHMCGSGVTACHNLLAMEHAGLKGSKLYAGSWSEWIRDPNRPIAN
jgi:thiosulfate/3-mercaptopyruvate sulfurtransferase